MNLTESSSRCGRCVFQPLKGFSLIIKQEVTHWSVLSWCLFAESLPLSLDTYMKRCFIQTATFFFFHFYLCKTLSWKHLWVLCTGSLQEVREMAVECNCVDCLLITSFRLKRSPVQKNLGDLLDINKHKSKETRRESKYNIISTTTVYGQENTNVRVAIMSCLEEWQQTLKHGFSAWEAVFGHKSKAE